VVSYRELARAMLRAGEPATAIELLRQAMDYPHNLGEGKHLLTPENELQLLMGAGLRPTGSEVEARHWLERAAEPQGDPDEPAGDTRYWRALALRKLGAAAQAEEQLELLATEAQQQARAEVRIPYFATSLPTMLLFDDDLTERSRQEAGYLEGLALLGRGRRRAARSCFEAVLATRPEHLEAALRLAELGA
jgi:tetratricopeptide (TPR) repeat protein